MTISWRKNNRSIYSSKVLGVFFNGHRTHIKPDMMQSSRMDEEITKNYAAILVQIDAL